MKPIDENAIRKATETLGRSQRGRAALTTLRTWFVAEGLGLDAHNQDAVLTLLLGAWSRFPGTVREEIDATIGGAV
ncbi:MAG: hypothetical protein KF777_01505 [Planctomycetaceae bacterium]|nr:hypothetical protein [Planctomycetaceae bacterium]